MLPASLASSASSTALFSISRESTANVLGYASIAFWLCAQFPQVLKNVTLQSAEGLALPFLLNWLFGDITNLIGCILTDQLPFQTYLAAYFCLVDFSLLAQFYYYRSLQLRAAAASSAPQETTPRLPASTHHYTATPSIHQSLILPAPSTAPLSHPLPRSRSTSHPGRPPFAAFAPVSALVAAAGAVGKRKRPWSSNTPMTSPSALHVDNSYAAIYEAALDVARAAERAGSKHRRLSRRNTDDTVSGGATGGGQGGQGMMDSFHSEMSATSSSRLSIDGRGRTLTRIADVAATPPDEEEENDDDDDPDRQARAGYAHGNGHGDVVMREAPRSKSRSLSLARGSGGRGTGRRAAGVAFMSLGLLVSWERIGGAHGHGYRGYDNGLVLSGRGKETGHAWPAWPTRHPQPLMAAKASSPPQAMYLFFDAAPPLQTGEGANGRDDQRASAPPHPDDQPSAQRIVGRISAWTCTTLYLTSRLPQIWKNFNRKSVEGLSILLFVFAFMGNLTYVFSILLNPAGDGDPAEAGHYLLEALPYLLGSGGTLIFDLTIMLQSIIYGSSPPIPSTPLDRASRKHYGTSRRRYRHLEDGRGISVSASGERQPLLSGATPGGGAPVTGLPGGVGAGLGLGMGLGARQRSRSRSPEVPLTRGRRKGNGILGGVLGLTPAPEEEVDGDGLKGVAGGG